MSALYSVRRGEAYALLREMPDASVDAVITDPPYSSGGQFRGDRTSGGNAKYVDGNYAEFAGDNRDQRAYLAWCSLWLSECLRVTRPGGVLVAFTDWRQLPTTTDAVQCGGWVWRGVLPWTKPVARPQLGRFAQSSEFAVWASNGPMPTAGECYPGHFHLSSPRDRVHPTEKPEELMRAIVRIVPEGGTVLDPFCGSGTTLAAALAEGRRALGFEITEAYARVARERCAAIMAGRDRFAPEAQLGLLGGAR